ncbi:Protein of unknown function [Gryllus bimaculatus]|nr:Protein of unknown function [Gryllus bimaculatus]
MQTCVATADTVGTHVPTSHVEPHQAIGNDGISPAPASPRTARDRLWRTGDNSAWLCYGESVMPMHLGWATFFILLRLVQIHKVLYETTRDVSAAEELLLGPRAPLPLPPLDACNESNTSDERSDKETAPSSLIHVAALARALAAAAKDVTGVRASRRRVAAQDAKGAEDPFHPPQGRQAAPMAHKTDTRGVQRFPKPSRAHKHPNSFNCVSELRTKGRKGVLRDEGRRLIRNVPE